MAFNSFQYALLLFAVVTAFWTLRNHPRLRLGLLLIASYVFYGFWDWRFLGLLALSTVVDFAVGVGLGRTEDGSRRRRLLVASVGTNLGILGFFKYFDFFIDSFAEISAQLGLSLGRPVLEVVLPVGISFYTFQTMSYAIDVYRRNLEPTRDLLAFAVYVSFFPQLVAGPIERAGRLLPQLEHPAERLHPEDVSTGLALITLGLFKKVAIADALAGYVEAVFSAPETHPWFLVLGGIYAFALQIYADFSGYSDIARGSARLVGVRLVRNFEQPYLSRNISEFWRTWHISLSEWLRDYLYIPLGGNRRGWRRTLVNLSLTMLLGGLWHGAAWTFVFWGGLHGLYLAVHRMWRSRTPGADPVMPRWRDALPVLGTFHLVCLGWVFFRADGFGNAIAVLTTVGTFNNPSTPVDTSPLILLAAAMVTMILIDVEQRRTGMHVPHLHRPVLRGALAGTAAAAVILFAGQASVPFLYFQF